MIPLIVIEGPTASGKSKLAIELASHLNTEIISADSRQVYKYMDIGTAKVTKEELKQIPHHMIDVLNPDERFNAGQFASMAADIASEIYSRAKIPIVCGGTGLYVRSMLEGLCHIPLIMPEIKEELLNRLVTEGLPVLYSELMQLDPDFAKSISLNDKQRIVRGLEVAIGTGKPLSRHWQEQRDNKMYKVFRILISPERQNLYNAIDNRIQQMVNEGLIEEIRSLLSMGYSETSPGLSSLGYQEFFPYINAQSDLSECCAIAAQHHRNYAKRQVTWYRKCTFDLTLSSPLVNISEISKLIDYH
jgi:tRNA dimethylallyltransferase